MLLIALRNKNTTTVSIMFVSALDVVAADLARLPQRSELCRGNTPQKP